MCLKLRYNSNNSYWQYCDISNCFLWVPQNWITYADLAHMWQNQCHFYPPNSHLFASPLKTHFPYWPISHIEPGPGQFVLDMVILVAQLQSRELCRESCNSKLRREICVGIKGQTWNVTFSCSTYLTEQYSLRKLSPKLVNLFKLGAWLSQRDLRNPLIWRHTHGIPFGGSLGGKCWAVWEPVSKVKGSLASTSPNTGSSLVDWFHSVRPSFPHSVSALDSFPIWQRWSLSWESVSRAMTYDLGLYLQSDSAMTLQ